MNTTKKLFLAAAEGDLAAVQDCLAKGVDLDVRAVDADSINTVRGTICVVVCGCS